LALFTNYIAYADDDHNHDTATTTTPMSVVEILYICAAATVVND